MVLRPIEFTIGTLGPVIVMNIYEFVIFANFIFKFKYLDIFDVVSINLK